MVRSGRATILSAAILIVAAFGIRPAAASSHPGYQISIETRFVEVDESFVKEIGVDFRSLDAAPGSPFAGGMAPGVLPLLQSSGQAAVLASPRVSVVEDQAATIKVGGRLTVPSGIPGTAVTFDDFGLVLKVTPQINQDGTITLELNIARDALDLGPTVPEIRTVRTATDVVLPNGETIVIGGLISDDLKNQAGRVPGLGRLPVLGSLFRAKEQGAAETTLIVLVTPTVLGEDGESSGGGAAAAPTPPPEAPTQTSFEPAPFGLNPGQFYVSAGAGAIFKNMPGFDWLRTESGMTIQVRPLLSEETDIVAPEIVFEGGLGLNTGLFGGKSRLSLAFSYLDGDTESSGSNVSAGGDELGVEFPNGTGDLIAAGFGDVDDVDFRFSYQAFDVSLKAYDEVTLAGKSVAYGGGLALRYADSDASLSFMTNGDTLQYVRRDMVDNFSIGPTIGATISHGYGFLTAYGGAEARGLISFADGESRVDRDNVSQADVQLSSTKFTYDLSLKAGARFDLDPVSIDLQGTYGYGNNNPMIEYQPFDPARLEFEGDHSWGARLSVIYKFH